MRSLSDRPQSVPPRLSRGKPTSRTPIHQRHHHLQQPSLVQHPVDIFTNIPTLSSTKTKTKTILFWLMASSLLTVTSSFTIVPSSVYTTSVGGSSCSSRRTSSGSCSSLSRSADSTTIAAATTTTSTNDFYHNKHDAESSSSSSSSSSSCSSLSSSSASSSSSESSTIARVVPQQQHSLRHVLGVEEDSSAVAKEYSPWIVGHRGCLYQELENTREGFQACADMGCDAVELDVFLLPKCQTLIVFHGGDGGSSNGGDHGSEDVRPGLLHDYCGVQGSILDYTYQEAITKLRFNPSHAELACPPEVIARGIIPTLEQVLSDAKQSGLFVKIELKGEGAVVPTLELVERLDMVHQVSYSSFDLTQLAELRALRKDRSLYPTGALFSTKHLPNDYILQAKNCGATEIHLQYDSCSVQRVQEIHQAGMGSMCWMRGPVGMKQDCSTKYWDVGNEDMDMYQALMDTGVQQLCINKPDVLIQWRRLQQIK